MEEINFSLNELNAGFSVYTYLNKDLQNMVENLQFDCDNSVVITNNGGVAAFKSTIGNAKRQPASTIKPLLVYAPAIQEKKIHSFTKILDEKIDFNGYSPENYDKKYHGNVTVKEAIKQSLNIPAVKVLQTMSFDTVSEYAQKLNINLEQNEKNLSLALGAMKYGLNLKTICDGYTTFANDGNFISSKFIKKICDKSGNVIYENNQEINKVYEDGTCSVINQILCETSKSGTARKLKNLNYDIATKTGTFGNSDGNSDAYAISYTSLNTIGIWLGDANNKKLNITGGGNCCEYVKEIADFLYSSKKPYDLEKQKGTQTIYIDGEEYNKNDKIILCDNHSPTANKLKVSVINSNLPQEVSTRFTKPTITKPTISVKNDEVYISLCQAEYYAYLIYKQFSDQKELIYDGKWKKEIIDKPNYGQYEYSVIPYYFDGNEKFFGDEKIIGKINISSPSNENKLPDIAYKDWYNF
jgi:membrane peptidoglycan carboxypeptidase